MRARSVGRADRVCRQSALADFWLPECVPLILLFGRCLLDSDRCPLESAQALCAHVPAYRTPGVTHRVANPTSHTKSSCRKSVGRLLAQAAPL